MQYVGTLFNTVTEFYKELNPSTLSGAIDVICVKHEDESLHCSPFHVRFGLLQLLRPHEKVVELEINGKKIDYRMKLGESGEAFFVFETEDPVPSEFATSPLMTPDDEDTNTEELDYFALPESQLTNGLTESPKSEEKELEINPLKNYNNNGKHLSNGEIVDNKVQEGGEGLILDKKGYNTRTVGKKSNILNSSELESGSGTSNKIGLSHKFHLSNEDLNQSYRHNQDDREVRSDGDNTFSDEEEYSNHYSNASMAYSDSEMTYKFNEESSIHKTDSTTSYGSYRRWTSWFRKSAQNLALSSDDEDSAPLEIKEKITKNKNQLTRTKRSNFAKTLRLTSDQLKTIGLLPGANIVKFTVGKASCISRIFLWNYYDMIVISDIDGTITKSDALGHIFNMVGKDWTHPGVAKLYTDIQKNGYKLMYLTSRAIGQADSTREYLKGIDQNQYQLPDGPVIMSPDRLFQSLHREVVLRKPHLFKMACLKDILSLFGNNQTAFYAGFGNRITDALSYRSVHVPVSRIFTIDYNGDIQHELIIGYNSSYIKLTDLVDQIFPPTDNTFNTDYNDWNYWKNDLQELDLDFLDDPIKKEDSKLTKTTNNSNNDLLLQIEGDDDDEELDFEDEEEEEDI